jgi:hypothetical protein
MQLHSSHLLLWQAQEHSAAAAMIAVEDVAALEVDFTTIGFTSNLGKALLSHLQRL